MVWGMADAFQYCKWKVIHFGRKNLRIKYTMKGMELSVTQHKRDLVLDVSSDLKVSSQCQQAYAKANRMIGLISRNIYHKSWTVMLQLYKTLVRPHVEYCTVAWSPYYKKDKEQIEKIQHRSTRLIQGMKGGCLTKADLRNWICGS